MTEAIGDMSASTNQKVRELADRIYDGMFNAHMNPGRLCYGRDDVATLITQAIAVETAVLRERVRTLEGLLKMSVGHIQDQDSPLAENIHRALLGSVEASKTAALSAADSPGAKAEDTASAGRCKFTKCWVGVCNQPCEGDYCHEHLGKKCAYCDNQATHDCGSTMGAFVCGALLCDGCVSRHNQKSHGQQWWKEQP